MDRKEPLTLQIATNGVHYFKYLGWTKQNSDGHQGKVLAGFSSRLGTIGDTTYEGLNYALHIADNSQQVLAHRQRLAEALEIPLTAWTCGDQVHGHQIVDVKQQMCGSGLYDRTSAIAQTDGLMTNETEIWLVSFYADCVPLFFWDEVHQVMAIAHAGWRGTVQEIAKRTVVEMNNKYGCEPHRIRALIGPAIGQCCYEVDKQVIDQLRTVLEQEQELEQVIQASDKDSLKYHVDLKRCNQMIMMKAGILTEHIEISQWCTSCRTDLFFSHRKEHGSTGRMVAWMYME